MGKPTNNKCQTHNTKATRSLLPKLFDSRFVEFADHDFIVRYIFPDIECFNNLKADPRYIEHIKKDPMTYSDKNNKTKYAAFVVLFFLSLFHD